MTDSDDLMPEIEATGEKLVAAREMIARRIIGQQEVIERTLIAILCGGHGLLVGAPGLAKTRLVETLGTVLGLVAHRVQFTPDLMPADILGAEVLETGPDGSRAFRFIDGPVFCQLLMADEINRASPRTQSALLQAMQEKEVSVAGQRRILPRPFHVLATQNPIEQEGTYPLPEAQLDRFLLQIDVDYPDRKAEREILLATTGLDEATAEPVFDAESLMAAQRLIRRLPVGEAVVEKILDLVRAARPGTADTHPAVREAAVFGGVHDVQREQRIAAQRKERIIARNNLEIQHFGEDRRQRSLCVGGGGLVFGARARRPRWQGQRLAQVRDDLDLRRPV